MPLIHRYTGECPHCSREREEEERATGNWVDDEIRHYCECGEWIELEKRESYEIQAGSD